MMTDISPIAQIIDDVKAASGNGTLFAIFLFALFWIWYRDEEKEYCTRIVYPVLLFFALMLNPLLMKYVWIPIFYVSPAGGGVLSTRMYVALPVLPVIAYFFTKILLSAKNGKEQIKIGIALVVLLVLTGGFVLYDNNLRIPQNKVQIDNDVVMMNEAILLDGQKAKAVVPESLVYCFRNYNTNMKVFSTRGVHNYAPMSKEYDDVYDIEEEMSSMWPNIELISEIGKRNDVTVLVFDIEYHHFYQTSPADYGYEFLGNFGQYDVYKMNKQI